MVTPLPLTATGDPPCTAIRPVHSTADGVSPVSTCRRLLNRPTGVYTTAGTVSGFAASASSSGTKLARIKPRIVVIRRAEQHRGLDFVRKDAAERAPPSGAGEDRRRHAFLAVLAERQHALGAVERHVDRLPRRRVEVDRGGAEHDLEPRE